MIVSGITVPEALNHYSLIKMLEENWGLGSLGKNDKSAAPIPQVWK